VLILKVVSAGGASRKALPIRKNLGGGIHTPRVFAYEWQGKDLRDTESVRVADKGLIGGYFCVFAHDGRDL
jgi:hypothetical protein